jgi:hypothetical protein
MQEGECIYSYTRAQAIKDGVLVDITKTARKVGLRYPVAVTDTLYHQYIEPTAILESESPAVNGRLMDVLMLLIFEIKRTRGNTSELHFKVSFLMDSIKTESVGVWAVINGGDDGNPVITLMLEGED